ncbi:MAG: efflux RND transporter permease subunit [Gammaproteobacteria bacterium]|nr:efflux RND transporter permease subunit [Gammaproteobacteria bacterium]
MGRSLPEFFIQRHVFAYMLSGVLLLFGLISYDRIGVDRFPKIDFPIISVQTVLPGASPEIVDSSVANLIETTVNSVPGIEYIQSTSAPGVSLVIIRFGLNKNVDIAFNEVQAKVNQILPDLPRESDPPVVAKVEFGALPVMWLALTGNRTLQQLNQYARNNIKKRLETIEGVGEVRLGGERKRTIRVALDPERMAAFGVAANDVIGAFSAEHLRLQGGFLVGDSQEKLVNLDLEFHDPVELEQLIVAYPQGAPIRLGDIADIEDGLEDHRKFASFSGQPTVGIGIVKVDNANTVAVVNEVERRLQEELLPVLPPGMELEVAYSDADLIEEIVAALEEHIVLGTLLTALVVLLFLKSLPGTFIIAAAIPVSLLGAVAVMYFAGFTFNGLTLLGLLLLIGIVVDDAIVVLENIYRQMEAGERDPMRAAATGSRQVVFAVLAATMTLVSIFAPVIFMEGIIGSFFMSFAVVVTVGVLVSLFVALSLTPALCARYLRFSDEHGPLYRSIERGFKKLDRGYRELIRWSLRKRGLVLLAAFAAVLSSGFFFTQVDKGFMPEEDEGRFLVAVKAPLGSSIGYTESRIRAIESVLDDYPEVTTSFATIGDDQARQVSQGSVVVNLAHWDDRNRSQAEIMESLRGRFAGIPGMETFVTEVPQIGGMRGDPLQFVLRGPDLERVAELAEDLRAELMQNPGIGNLDLLLQMELPQLEISPHRARIRDLGLTTRDVALAVNVLSGGFDVARYNDEPGDGERYDVRLKAGQGTLQQAPDLSRIYLRTPAGEQVRLDNLVDLKTSLGPAVVSRYDLQYSAQFLGTPRMAEAAAIDYVIETAEAMLPPGYGVRMIGRSSEFGKTVYYMLFAFVTAMILVYMVLASQFNSFVQPLVIMVAQPLAIIGGVGALWLTGNTLNIYSMIGLVLLVGLVAKNSILLVDLTNQMRREGQCIDEALLSACPVRMRPVLMTSATIILALAPAATGLGAGADTNGPLAIAVIGGLVSSTLLTLVVVPALYSLVEHRVQRFAQRRAARRGESIDNEHIVSSEGA